MADHVDQMLTFTAMGTAEDVRDYLAEFAERTAADELITAHHAPGIDARLRSVDLAGRSRCSNRVRAGRYSESGASRDRTGDLLHAMQALSQLSYSPSRVSQG